MIYTLYTIIQHGVGSFRLSFMQERMCACILIYIINEQYYLERIKHLIVTMYRARSKSFSYNCFSHVIKDRIES